MALDVDALAASAQRSLQAAEEFEAMAARERNPREHVRLRCRARDARRFAERAAALLARLRAA